MSKTGASSIDNEHDGMKWACGLTLLANERYSPAECVHEFGKPKWVWPPVEPSDSVYFPVALEHRCHVSMGIEVIRRRGNSYDAGVVVALAVYTIPIHNSIQQELQVIRRKIRRTHPPLSHVHG